MRCCHDCVAAKTKTRNVTGAIFITFILAQTSNICNAIDIIAATGIEGNLNDNVVILNPYLDNTASVYWCEE